MITNLIFFVIFGFLTNPNLENRSNCIPDYPNSQADLQLICPVNQTEPQCQTQAQIDTRYSSWLTTAATSGGCNTSLSNNGGSAPSACGGDVTVTFTATSSCDSTITCSAVFTVTSAPPVLLSCPPILAAPPCTSQTLVDSLYLQWLTLVSSFGGCKPFLSNNSSGPPDFCGGSKTVTFQVTSTCQAPVTCSSVFTVSSAAPIDLQCPPNQSEEAGQSQAEIDAKFLQWLNAGVSTGGCQASLSNNNNGAPPNTGGSTTVMWTVTSDCEPDVTCTSVFTVKMANDIQNESDHSTFELYPNPSFDDAFIEVKFNSTKVFKLVVYNVTGTSVWSQTFKNSNQKIKLPANLLSSGVHYIQLSCEGINTYKKWMVLQE